MRRLCVDCYKRPPKFKAPNGQIKTDRSHTLCEQCFRAWRNRTRRHGWSRS